MLHPVGNLPAHVYWRRRLFFVALPVLGIILIAWALLSGGGGSHPAAKTSATSTTPSATPTSPIARDTGSVTVTTTTPTATSPSLALTAAKGADKGFCTPADLTVTATAAQKSFVVKSKPTLYMQVTDVAAAPCKLDVADKHVEWRVYSGDVRVWGSHDCAITPGTNVVTLMPQRAVRLSITWSGLTSTPGCTGTRIVVQAGTYRLYAYLNGKQSPASTFEIR